MEKVAGERFDRLMGKLVLAPLGMRGGFNPAEMPRERVADIATLYRKARDDDGPWDPRGPWIAQVDDYSRDAPVNRAGGDYAIGSNGTLFGPQGNLRASVADLGRVMLVLMNGGVLDGVRIFRGETIAAMLARQWTHEAGNGESTYGTRRERLNAWGLGVQHFLDRSGPASGDRLVDGGGFPALGHLGDAYGLHGTLVFDPQRRDGIVYLAGGTGFDPETDRGRYSGLNRYEERILTAVYRHALRRGD
jgi:CubicO group peptidase (beta-lactamase class C family)